MSPPTDEDSLETAISHLTAKRAQATLMAIISQRPSVRELAEGLLLVDTASVLAVKRAAEADTDDESELESSGEAGESVQSKSQPSRKRQRRYDVCTQCNEDFDVLKNKKDSCRWHPDLKAADYDSDFWADHDENTHGPYEAYLEDPDFQKGSMYGCCERDGNSKGCVLTVHNCDPTKVPDPELSSDEE